MSTKQAVLMKYSHWLKNQLELEYLPDEHKIREILSSYAPYLQLEKIDPDSVPENEVVQVKMRNYLIDRASQLISVYISAQEIINKN